MLDLFAPLGRVGLRLFESLRFASVAAGSLRPAAASYCQVPRERVLSLRGVLPGAFMRDDPHILPVELSPEDLPQIPPSELRPDYSQLVTEDVAAGPFANRSHIVFSAYSAFQLPS
jgi:hypothetical protein